MPSYQWLSPGLEHTHQFVSVNMAVSSCQVVFFGSLASFVLGMTMIQINTRTGTKSKIIFVYTLKLIKASTSTCSYRECEQ